MRLLNPNNRTESKLQAIWESVLKQGSIPTTTPFFEVGGHSLAAIQICYAISQAFKFDLALSEFFANNTIEKLALLLQSKTQDNFIWPQAQEDAAHAGEPFPLTEVQQGYWLGRKALFSLNVATHLYSEYDFHHLDIERLQLAFNRVIERHGMLRAVVTEEGMQKILPFSPYTLVSQDLRQLSASQQRSQLQAWRQAMSHQILTPPNGRCLICAYLLRQSNIDYTSIWMVFYLMV